MLYKFKYFLLYQNVVTSVKGTRHLPLTNKKLVITPKVEFQVKPEGFKRSELATKTNRSKIDLVSMRL